MRARAKYLIWNWYMISWAMHAISFFVFFLMIPPDHALFFAINSFAFSVHTYYYLLRLHRRPHIALIHTFKTEHRMLQVLYRSKMSPSLHFLLFLL